MSFRRDNRTHYKTGRTFGTFGSSDGFQTSVGLPFSARGRMARATQNSTPRYGFDFSYSNNCGATRPGPKQNSMRFIARSQPYGTASTKAETHLSYG